MITAYCLYPGLLMDILGNREMNLWTIKASEELQAKLQEELEGLYRAHVLEEVGSDIYYDPKDMKKSEIPQRYRECLEYGKRHCPHQIKTGWEAIRG